MRIWIDIENPPQVRYLLPFKRAFEAIGAHVTITARDYGFTYALLEDARVPFVPIGTSYGATRRRKLAGLARRTRALAAYIRAGERPRALLCAGRASAAAARILGIPTFMLSDYEHAEVTLYRLTGSNFVFPDVIDPDAFIRRGIDRARLIPYHGLKEDLTFSGVDLDAVAPHEFAELNGGGQVRVLFRPPADESHYYVPASGALAERTLAHLASREDAVVVFSRRYPRQVDMLRGLPWRHPPVVLGRPVPTLPLLKSVDAVVSSGGTMLREAAWLGIPAYSIFGGTPGGVDRHLEALGRLVFVSAPSDLQLDRGVRRPVLSAGGRLLDQLVETIVERSV
jgi:predicted glycosyltransferase